VRETVAGARRQPRVVASHEPHVQGEVHAETLHGGAHVGLLHRVQRAGVARHSESQSAEGVPGEPEDGQRHVPGAGEPQHRQLHQGGRGDGPGAGGRHDHMEDDRAEQHTLGADHIHRVVERPEPQAEAVHADTDHRRVPYQYRPVGLYLLLLRAAHGGRRAGGVRATGHDRRMDDDVYGRIQLRGRRNYGENAHATNRYSERFLFCRCAHRNRVVRCIVSGTRILWRVHHSHGIIHIRVRVRHGVHQGGQAGDERRDQGTAEEQRILRGLRQGLLQPESHQGSGPGDV